MNVPARLEQGNVSPTQESKVLKRDDYLAYKTAEVIVAEAKREAKAIVDKAKEAYESEKQKGYRDGKEKANRELAEQITATVGKTIDYLGDIEGNLADVVLVALRKILDEFSDEELTLRVVRQGLTAIRGQQRVAVKVAPGMVESVEEYLKTFTPHIPFIEVIADSEIASERCILESDLGTVDSSIGNQLEAIKNSVAKRLFYAENTADLE